MLQKRIVFVGIFLALVLALSVSAAGATDTPASQPTVKLWVFYDKDVNAYPTGWTYLDPVITNPMDWQQDSPWLPFPSPHYALYGGTWGSETMGALIQEGDFGPGVAEIPLADGLYWVMLSAPPGNWKLTTDAVQKVYVWNGSVYVQWANEGLWYGDKVLVGIIDGVGCSARIAYVDHCWCGYVVEFRGEGFTPYGDVHTWGVDGQGHTFFYHDDHSAGPDGEFWCGPEGPEALGPFTIYAEDMETGCVATYSDVRVFHPGED